MELNSPQFWIIFLVAVVILVVKTRRKGPRSPQRPKGVSGRVYVVYSDISVETPLPCLIDDERPYGPLFQAKEPPQLPHCEGCLCQINESYTDSAKLYRGESRNSTLGTTDLGRLDWKHKKYYQCRLIAAHPEANEELSEEYQSLADKMDIEVHFQEKVNQHLAGKR